jgi:hypothetical protein
MGMQTEWTPTEPKSLASLGGGLAVPRRLRLTADKLELPYLVKLEVVLEAGRFICEQLTCSRRKDGPPVTGEGIRALPIASMIRRGVEPEVLNAQRVDADTVKLTPIEIPDRLTGPTPEALRAVAVIYRLAYATGSPPTKAVMDRFGLPRSTAGRWVARARDAGLLGAASPRKAGESRIEPAEGD